MGLHDNLKSYVKTFPLSPGIYKMINASGKIIYVGKAKQLRRRVLQYFSNNIGGKTKAMMTKVVAIETSLTPTEEDALLLEANLIKKEKPRYNILLRDDKSYPYLFISKDQYPRLDLYRGSREPKGHFFGPYPDARSVRQAVILLQKLFKIRPCRNGFFRNRSRPCLQYQIGRCSAPCVGYVDEANYQNQINDALLFLQGKSEDVMKRLTDRMQSAAVSLNYELAAQLRDQITLLRRMQQGSTESSDRDADVLLKLSSGDTYVVCICFIRGGLLMGKRCYTLTVPLEEQTDFWPQFLMQFYLNRRDDPQQPSVLMICEPIKNRLSLSEAMTQAMGRKIKIITRVMQSFHPYRRMAEINAKHVLDAHISQHSSWQKKCMSIQQCLGLAHSVEHIECFDISHTAGQQTRGSCVVFTPQGKKKSAYRQFCVQEAKASDDYAAMREVLFRRFQKLVVQGISLPDVLIIDGGKGQLNAAANVLASLQIEDMVLAGVVKGQGRRAALDRLLIYPSYRVVDLTSNQEVMFAVQQIRDEAHRFAIECHRKARRKQFLRSKLDEIEGVGPVLRQRLLTHFGGLPAVLSASIDALSQVEGVGCAKARCIYYQLHPEQNN